MGAGGVTDGWCTPQTGLQGRMRAEDVIFAIFKGALFTSNPSAKKSDVAYKVNLQFIKRYLTSFEKIYRLSYQNYQIIESSICKIAVFYLHIQRLCETKENMGESSQPEYQER